LTLWLEVPRDAAGAAGPLMSWFDPSTRTGFDLSTISSAGGYGGPSDELRLAFGIDAGSEPRWSAHGRPGPASNYVSNSLTVFEGALHAATSDAPEPADRGHVYRHHGGTDWEDFGKVAREDATGIGPMIVHQGSLYVASWNYDWTRVDQQDLDACHVYRYVAPGRWEDCGQPGRSKRLFSLASWRGDLFVAGDDHSIHVFRGEGRWELVRRFGTFAHPMHVYRAKLIVGMLQPATVWAFDGHTWDDLGNPVGDPEVTDEVHSIVTYRDRLHVGTWRLGRVARWEDPARRWRATGRLGDATEVMDLVVYNGKLYGSSIPRAEVFRYERDRLWTSLRRLYDPPGWQPVLVRNMKRPPDGDRRMRDWTRVTSLTQHDGRVFASVGSCTSAAMDAPADVRGSVHAFAVGAVATTARGLAPGWHHVAAVRTAGRVTIHVDGRAAAERSGPVEGRLCPPGELTVAGADSPVGLARAELHHRALEAREIQRMAAGSARSGGSG
jgi:hypothetical protein